MGELEQSVIRQLLLRIHPFRKYIWALCALSMVLALLIILNSIWIIAAESSALHQVVDSSFVVFSEVLAWMLLLLSCVGFKMTCMATKAFEANCAQLNGPNGRELPSVDLAMELTAADQLQRRPYSAPNWTGAWPLFGIFANESNGTGGGGPFDLPGSVPPGTEPPLFDPAFYFPPPPPRYSSLLDVPPPGAPMVQRVAQNAQNAGGGGGRRASSHFPAGGQLMRATASSPAAANRFVRSPPPPYCSPNG